MTASDHLGVQFRAVKTDGGGIADAWHEGNQVGSMAWEHHIDSQIDHVFVRPEWRGKGIATTMHAKGSELMGHPLGHSRVRTRAGDAWAKKVGGKLPPLTPAMEDD